jgi:hypothetical protein
VDLVVEDVKDKNAKGHVRKLKERVKAIHDKAQRRMEMREAAEADKYT